jgi:hypothetical protein
MRLEEIEIAQTVIWELIENHKSEKQALMKQFGAHHDTDPFPITKRLELHKLYDCYDLLEQEKIKH